MEWDDRATEVLYHGRNLDSLSICIPLGKLPSLLILIDKCAAAIYDVTMPRGKFEVNAGLLHCGGDSSEFAGAAAKKAATRLAETSPAQGIFGDFDAANTFQQALTTARDDHVQRSHDHDARLRGISGTAQTGAWAVTNTDGNSADAIGSVGDEIGS